MGSVSRVFMLASLEKNQRRIDNGIYHVSIIYRDRLSARTPADDRTAIDATVACGRDAMVGSQKAHAVGQSGESSRLRIHPWDVTRKPYTACSLSLRVRFARRSIRQKPRSFPL